MKPVDITLPRNMLWSPALNIALTHVAGRVGDHNNHAMRATPVFAEVLSECLGVSAKVLGEPEDALSTSWDQELAAALPLLRQLSERYDELLAQRTTPVTVLSRCAPALATLPMVARHRPDAVVIWFDAHADLNTPENSTTGYLGGLALSGPLGFWDSGLGAGLDTKNAVLVGARDLDEPEQRLVDDGVITLVPVRETMAEELRSHVAGRPVYVHFDCDVLEPHTVPTDYLVPGGMTIDHLRACCEILAGSEVVGIEIGELEALPGSTDSAPATLIASAFDPLFRAADRRNP